MAKAEPRSRIVIGPLAQFDLYNHSRSSVRSLAIFRESDSRAVFYVGTQSGTVLSLTTEINNAATSAPDATTELEFSKNASFLKKLSLLKSVSASNSPVDSILVLGEVGKLLLLSDGSLFMVDSALTQPPKRLSFSKGISLVTRRMRSNESDSSKFLGTVNSYSEQSSTGQRLMQRLGGGSRANGLRTKEPELHSGENYVFAIVIGKKLMLVELVFGHGASRSDRDINGVTGSLVILKEIQCVDGIMTMALPFGGEGIGPCIVASEEEGDGEFVAVATATKVICYKKLPFEEQIKDLLRKKNYNEAISLVEELEAEGEISKDFLSFVHAQVGFLLLFDLHFEEAVDHFLLSETMQPSEVFPFIMRDPNRWSLLVPRNRYWGLHPPPAPLEDVVDNGLMTIQRASFLRKAGVETIVDNAFFLNPPNRADLLESAIKNISRYLEACREKNLMQLVREGVDTLLMYLYRALNRADDMERLASSTNWCVVEELERILEGSGHLRTLAFLYASKGMSSKAVAIWRILARNYSSGLWKEPALENCLHNNEAKVISGKEVAAAEASKILEESSDQDLILQHLGWIADISQVLAVEVLTSDRREIQLSPDAVITAIDPHKVDILQRYLQWLIEEQDCNDTQLHTLYALSLAKSTIEAFEPENPDSGNLEVKNLATTTNSIFQTPVRERLQIFLQSSDLYDPEEVLDLIEGSELWLEKAILYRRLGQETLVLQILALKLEDSEAAEQYCAEIGRADAYMQLLEMYLDPQDGKDPMFTAAVRLLHNHGEALDPLQVLEKLSPDMPLQLASETLLRMLRARVHHHRQGQIVHSLSRAVDIDARLSRLEERSRHVQINDESLCDSCHARLGTKLFAMYPDDTVVCYKCYRRQETKCCYYMPRLLKQKQKQRQRNCYFIPYPNLFIKF
ncbi:vacuolar sorting protein 3 isoform X4 [Neltuma alba]|uniref:vacuolar sorting protein 3 isoform X4 n=1 Tax=Neltuma alba TaxID=207710 RepID=UPI0010A3392A|nr:vacuolar sorting protein 3-like isoform X4 [Prosopis alba]